MEQSPDPRLIAMLAWYRDMGVTDVLTDEPIDWLVRGESVLALPEPPLLEKQAPAYEDSDFGFDLPPARPTFPSGGGTAVSVRNFAPPPTSEAENSARALAEQAQSLEQLRAALQQFDGCALRSTAKNLCFFRGAPKARLMVIGEAPGREEDLEGKPFVGRAGKLLDRMLAAIGLSEEVVHITNIVYWRPPGNRTPTPQEALVCRPFLMRQIELVAPDFLLLLGAAAARQMLGVTDGILRIRGKWYEVEVRGRSISAIPTLHPAYLLRTPAAKKAAWRDLLSLRARLEGSVPSDAAGPASA